MAGHRPDVQRALARRAKQRAVGPGPYIRGARVSPTRRSSADEQLPHGYPFVPAVHQIERLRFDQPVTLLSGENGAGKSTLIEALAIAAGFAARGGALADELRREFEPKAEAPECVLADRLDLLHGRCKPRAGFFLRAERFYDVATAIDEKRLTDAYGGGSSLHARSHGESFLALAENRFGSNGLYIRDEPEAALSVIGQIALLNLIRVSTDAGAQFIIATHSPVLLSCPGAAVYELSAAGVEHIDAADSDPVRLTRTFLNGPDRFLDRLSADGPAAVEPT